MIIKNKEYIKRKYICGSSIEITIVPNINLPKHEKNQNIASQQQLELYEKRNHKNRANNIRRLIKNNFNTDDLFVSLELPYPNEWWDMKNHKWNIDDEEKQINEIKKAFKKLIEHLDYHFAEKGYEYKWLKVIEKD